MYIWKWRVYSGATAQQSLFLRERHNILHRIPPRARSLKSWTGVPVFLIPADVFTRAVWQLIGIYGVLL